RSLEGIHGVQSVLPAIFQQALVTSEAHLGGTQVMLKGVRPDAGSQPGITRAMVGDAGALTAADGSAGISIGAHLAKKLGAGTGDTLTVTVPTEQSGTFLPRSSAFEITRIYETGFFEFDSRWIYIDLDDARSLLRMDEAANVLEIDVRNDADVDEVLAAVSNATRPHYVVTDWREMNDQLFDLLRLQQFVLFIVIGLIVFVSTFNVVSTLIMTIHEKRRETGLLAAIGANRRLIRRIFIWYGFLVGCFGTFIGIILGVAVSWAMTEYEIISFGPEIAQVYFVSSIPFITRWIDLATIATFALLVAWIATLLPSMRAARLSPVEALRWE
ncbi:MAG TPA: ABC transporter permease, partial [Thermoanaerobaculia bacterium]|nr:ABC transporter permease [Thermoanaerobaculia bacterium]